MAGRGRLGRGRFLGQPGTALPFEFALHGEVLQPLLFDLLQPDDLCLGVGPQLLVVLPSRLGVGDGLIEVALAPAITV